MRLQVENCKAACCAGDRATEVEKLAISCVRVLAEGCPAAAAAAEGVKCGALVEKDAVACPRVVVEKGYPTCSVNCPAGVVGKACVNPGGRVVGVVYLSAANIYYPARCHEVLDYLRPEI